MGSLVAELAEKLSSATNNLDFDEQTMFLNTSADTVGIGTNSPASKLDVRGTMQVGVNDTGYDVKFFGATSGKYWLWDEDADGTVLVGSSTQTGNAQLTGTLTVGVNDAGHDVKFFGAASGAFMQWDEDENSLVVRGAAADAAGSTGRLSLETAQVSVEDGDILGRVDFRARLETQGSDASKVSASIWAEADATFTATVNSTELVFATATDDEVVEHMRIDSAGKVGIGTTAPSATIATGSILEISHNSAHPGLIIDGSGGTGNVPMIELHADRASDGDTAGNIYFFNNGATAGSFIRGSRGSTDIKGDLEIWTSNTEKMRIDEDGNVGIGTSAPGDKLDLAGGYLIREQGRQNHISNTYPAPHYRFDGNADYINLGTNVAQLISNTNYSLEFIFMRNGPKETAGGYEMLLDSWNGGAGQFIVGIEVANGRPALWTHTGSWTSGGTATTITDGIWYHLVTTFSPTEKKFYLNGVLVETVTGTWAANGGAGKFCIGGRYDNTHNFNGQISKTHIYNTELTAAEVKELYSGASVPYKHKGANQTLLNTSTAVNGSGGGTREFATFGSASTTGFVGSDGSDAGLGYFAVSVVKGKRYRLSCNVVVSGGTFGMLGFSDSRDWYDGGGTGWQGGASFVDYSSTSAAGGGADGVLQYTGSLTGTAFVWADIEVTQTNIGYVGMNCAYGTGTMSCTISNMKCHPIGAISEYDGSSVGPLLWDDKSGNGVNGSVVGATIHNNIAQLTADNYNSLSYYGNVNDLTTAGLYNVSYAASNNPTGTVNWNYAVIEGSGQASVVSQLAIQDTGGSRYTRARNSGTWSAWSAFN